MKIYTAKELAKILKVSPMTIYRQGVRGELETIRVGKAVRFILPRASSNKER